ncbi:MAG: RNA polymerase subunit sigma-24, partial [Bryobacteraceae bacterium]
VSMAQGLEPALALLDSLAATGELDGYHLFHATRADLLRRQGLHNEAAQHYARARELATSAAEQRFLERRLREMTRVR